MELSLIRHALGKKLFYDSLLTAIKQKWLFKGSLKLLTLEGDFLLFKFFYREDYDIICDIDHYFLSKRLFFFLN